jgi:RNase P subunit RPR2
VYGPTGALIRRYLEFTTNVVKRIKMNGVPEINIEIVKNCTVPANTKRDIRVKLKRESPA